MPKTLIPTSRATYLVPTSHHPERSTASRHPSGREAASERLGPSISGREPHIFTHRARSTKHVDQKTSEGSGPLGKINDRRTHALRFRTRRAPRSNSAFSQIGHRHREVGAARPGWASCQIREEA
ncbi:hypothetical protein MFRU_015g01150 [Monilinia fructicola]|nr:hypothetical protein MFRU_015g01150 [Monilinia fructicola]